MATTEGTLVASYNRGMRLLSECGGVTTTVVDEAMQRAPVFILADALEGAPHRCVHRDGSGRRQHLRVSRGHRLQPAARQRRLLLVGDPPGIDRGDVRRGTGLATQRECLELLGCHGTGKVHKFAEICAAVVLAGETSLTSAVLHGDWVTSHDQLGRNRP